MSKLIALGILGRYEEAVACGMEARDTLLAYGDELGAGKVEQNLGGMAWRRDRYREAELFHRAARERFAAAGDRDLLVAAENALAADLARQFRLQEAAAYYASALARAEEAGLELRRAEVESNLGNLALARGHYAQALDYLERSRRRYAALGMPHESAFAEQELAEAYLDLNMAAEAAAIYARVTPTFAALGMRAEQAWALAHHGLAALRLGQPDEAVALFEVAHELFLAEGNHVSAALVTLYKAQHAQQRGAYTKVVTATEASETVLAAAGATGYALLARWLRGEALGALDRSSEARATLETALAAAEQNQLPQIAQRCQTSLGHLALVAGDPVAAEAALTQAIRMLDELRAPLPSDELRTAFMADKLGPFVTLMRLMLESNPARVVEALTISERARARALLEMLGRSTQLLVQPRDAYEAELVARITALREELNWLAAQRGFGSGGESPSVNRAEQLQAAIAERERAILELSRQLQLRGGTQPGQADPFDLPGLQQALGDDTALVAYCGLGDELIAFVVTGGAVELARNLASEGEVAELVSQLRFQIDALRRGARLSTTHSAQLLRRAHHYLQRLHALLLAPLLAWTGPRRLVVVPYHTLHYVPFHALFDGTRYLIEQREVCTVPSASVLQRCLQRPECPHQQALLLGVPDTHAPRVRDEVLGLAQLFQEPILLLDGAATATGLRRHAPTAAILHLACHGTFRPDNPLFSALHLADGPFTTRDAYSLQLRCNLVVLSACETGVSTIAPGDELIGLARGFFAAGAPALLVSLWAVDDAAAARLMGDFYTRLRAGERPAQALRAAQRVLLASAPHPFFWAPFTLMGRW